MELHLRAHRQGTLRLDVRGAQQRELRAWAVGVVPRCEVRVEVWVGAFHLVADAVVDDRRQRGQVLGGGRGSLEVGLWQERQHGVTHPRRGLRQVQHGNGRRSVGPHLRSAGRCGTVLPVGRLVVVLVAVRWDDQPAARIGVPVPRLVVMRRADRLVLANSGVGEHLRQRGRFVGGDLLRDQFQSQRRDRQVAGGVESQLPACCVRAVRVVGKYQRNRGAGVLALHCGQQLIERRSVAGQVRRD